MHTYYLSLQGFPPTARHHLLLASMYSSTRDLSARLGTKKGAMGNPVKGERRGRPPVEHAPQKHQRGARTQLVGRASGRIGRFVVTPPLTFGRVLDVLLQGLSRVGDPIFSLQTLVLLLYPRPLSFQALPLFRAQDRDGGPSLAEAVDDGGQVD